jgi:signal transduction histidine kinase/DNA-binding response OmpR family regulator
MPEPDPADRPGAARPGLDHARSWLPYLVVALAGLAVAWALADSLRKAESSRMQGQFEQVAQQRVLQVDARLNAALNDLVALRAFMDVASHVRRAQFQAFCDPLLRRNPSIRALEWIPRVDGAGRAALEARAHADGAPGFHITARSPDGAMRPEAARDEYFPVYYVEPLHGNRAALGFDLNSNPVRRLALERAAASGKMVATARVALVQDPDGQYGFLVFYPVFDAQRAGRHGALRGFVLGVFSIGSLLQGSDGAARPGSAAPRLAVFDQTGASPGRPAQVLYPRGLRSSPSELLRGAVSYQRVFDIGQRQWRVLAYAAHPLGPGNEARVVFGAVLLATLLVLLLMRQVELVRDSETRRIVAQRADDAKSRFVAKVSHEVRTPLNGVVGMLELLLRSSLQPAQRRMAEVSHRSAVSLLGIVNDLLDFSKIEAGRLELVDEVVDLQALLADVTELYADAAARGGCSLSMHIEPDVPRHIRGDAGRLRQVLSNLVSNAVKFSSGLTRHGEVRVHVRRLGGHAHAPRLGISVRDNGVGMEASTLARLFRPFEQAQGANAPRQTGTGLGLAISRELVAAMGGSIRARSRPGMGSRLDVTLALREARQAPSPSPAPAAPAAPATQPLPGELPVLVAEDNPTNREVIGLQLRHLGLRARIAPDGRAALSLWEHEPFAAVLTDLHMPDMDGFELAREIRRRERAAQRPATPIIALTAAAHADELERALASGMDVHLTKPVALDALRATLHALLARRPGEGAALEPQASCLDLAQLRMLVGDDPRVVDSLLAQYADELRTALQCMQQAAEAADPARLGELAHRLKSSSRTVGAAALGLACDQLERQARDHAGRPAEAAQTLAWLQPVQACAQRVQQQLGASAPS